MTISSLYDIFLQHPVITTDSRDCPAGSMFFALKGETFDGNAYALKSLELGCAYAVVDEAEYATDPRCILVEDVLNTLQLLANHHRKALGTPVIGVTGTNGKTTTKELISAVLSEKYNVLYTQGNFNNHIGVPKTLLRLTKEHEIAVVEMGANHPGEIKTLVDIVEPDFGIITNVGKAHLEGFGSFEGVIRTKGELYDFLRSSKKHTVSVACSAASDESSESVSAQQYDCPKVFIHADNEHLLGISQDLELEKYGTCVSSDLAVYGEITECAPFLSFSWRNQNAGIDAPLHRVDSHLIGSYNIYNMLAAATIGLHFGVSEEQVDHALANYIPSNNRSQLTVTSSNKLIVDTYNANPTSMNAALVNFRDMKVTPKMAILGDMRELGDVSAEEHQKVVDFLKQTDITNVWLVGSEFSKTDCNYRKFENVDQVKEEIAVNPPKDEYILIKGSNGIKLFQLPELL